MTAATNYVALLRGINVGGHKKVPMTELASLHEDLGFTDITTIINTGNVVFTAPTIPPNKLAIQIQSAIKQKFGFDVAVQVRHHQDFVNITNHNPFPNPDPNLHFYLTFLNKPRQKIPTGVGEGIKLLTIKDAVLFSTLDKTVAKSTDFMTFLDAHFGKTVTTRNLNTIKKIAQTLQ